MSMFVFSNLAISLDGKIATTSRVHFPLGTAADFKQMQVLRKRADAILMGASTLRAYRLPLLVTGARKQPVNVVVSSKLDGISPAWKFFTKRGARKILFVSHEAPESRVRRFEKVAEIVRLSKPTRTNPLARQILRALEMRGIRNLLVEGGGSLMWDFVAPNLIDELHVTLTPRLLGGTEAPTLVDGKGFDPKDVVNLKLKSCRRVGDELYLIYARKTKRGP